jgi:Mg-chelatase subunit ChlI
MNPEEGDLRPQLLDRFAFSVQISGLLDPEQRVRIMERRIAFELDPEGFREKWADHERRLSDRIAHAREVVNQVRYMRRDLASIAHLTASMKVDGHRADLVILRGAQAHAALQGREFMADEDVLLAAELALPHRIKSRPFQESGVNLYDLEERLEQAQSEWGSGEQGEMTEESDEMSPVKKNRS